MPADVPVPPDPRGRAYAWFVANEQQERGQIHSERGLTLPPATSAHPSLPIFDDKG